MKKIIISLSLILAATAATVAQTADAFKLGYVNMEYTFLKLKNTPEVKQAESELETWYSQKEMVLKQLEGELTQLQGKMQNSTNPMEQQALQAELEGKYRSFQIQQQGMQQEAGQKEAELMKPTIDKINAAIKKVGDAENYTYIFTDGLGGNSIVLYAKNEGDNLTIKVLKELGVTVPDAE